MTYRAVPPRTPPSQWTRAGTAAPPPPQPSGHRRQVSQATGPNRRANIFHRRFRTGKRAERDTAPAHPEPPAASRRRFQMALRRPGPQMGGPNETGRPTFFFGDSEQAGARDKTQRQPTPSPPRHRGTLRISSRLANAHGSKTSAHRRGRTQWAPTRRRPTRQGAPEIALKA